eukprot:1026740-Amphidinium_carterae.1
MEEQGRLSEARERHQQTITARGHRLAAHARDYEVQHVKTVNDYRKHLHQEYKYDTIQHLHHLDHQQNKQNENDAG